MTKEQEKIKMENENKRINETILLCTEFLLTNSSDIELSNRTGFSPSTVGRRLTNLEYIKKAYAKIYENLKNAGIREEKLPKNGTEIYVSILKRRQENLRIGKTLGGLTSHLNHGHAKDETDKFIVASNISLEKVYHTFENQYKFLVHVALYFRLHLDTLSTLFQIDEKKLLENMFKVSPGAYDSLKMLFYHDGKDQNLARSNFISYFELLDEAISKNDLDEKRRLINLVTDAKALSIQKNRKPGQSLTDEDFGVLLRYQLKYTLTADDISYIFSVKRDNYLVRIEKYLENKDELRSEYEYLVDYLKNRTSGGGRRG